MKTIIAGSREGVTLDHIIKAVAECGWTPTSVVSGTAKGADKLGEEFAEIRGLEIIRFPANWDAHGKQAGYLRNVQMAENSEALIAVWDGKSKGTNMMIEIAQKRGMKVHIHKTQQEKTLDTSSPKYRLECEARYVLAKQKEKRMPYCDSVRAIRGDKAADELIAEVKRQHKLNQEKTAELEL